MSKDLTVVPVSDIKEMAASIAKSGLFGISNADQAMALMLIAYAEGNHPAIAARDYHIIKGRPALKADAMLARFQAAGGKVQWHKLTDAEVSATFSHASGGSATIDWDIKRSQQAQLGGNGMWSKFPRQMLRARVISEGIRTVFPGVIVGSYTPEEINDFQGTTIEAEQPKSFSIHSPDGMSQDEKKALYMEALDSLEKVQDEEDYKSWVDKYDTKLSKNISKARYDEISQKAIAVQLAVTKVEIAV